MAHRLGIFRWAWTDRDVINKNADALESVEVTVSKLQATVARQGQEILHLRALLMGVVEVIGEKISFDDAELERAVNAAWTQLSSPLPSIPERERETHPGLSSSASDATPKDVVAATALLHVAENHHSTKRFAAARTAYREVIDRYGDTPQASIARERLEDLRDS